ncbi:hypothetical protein L345_15952, partial [Ophiophagus hannah]
MKTFVNMVLQAIKYDQIDVFGYMFWSLLGGSEWQEAFNNQRGLFHTVTNNGRTYQAQPVSKRVLQDDAEGPPPHKPKGKGNYWTGHVDLNGLEATLFWPPSH